MGCVSSNLLSRSTEDEFGTSAAALGVGHHIVSLTSTTYGLLSTLDPPPTTNTNTPPPHPHSRFKPDHVINSWDLMAGLDTTSFRFPLPKPFTTTTCDDKENSNPNLVLTKAAGSLPLLSEERFERICPPNGEKRVVIYTTTLRGVRRTFEACNAVRAAFDAFGVKICERDVSMDSGFKEELRELLKEREAVVPPRVFVKGFYIGGAEEMLKVAEEGLLGELLQGLPRKPAIGAACEGCGDMRFLPCFRCNGSCKTILINHNHNHNHKLGGGRRRTTSIVVKCTDCNENGLVLCPLCS